MIEERGCFGVPDLIVEVLSPNTSKKDLNPKYAIYEEVSVKEYWILMPYELLIEIFILEQGQYRRNGIDVFEDIVSPSILPELEISLSEVFVEKNKQ